jgi:hypothetical protein
MVSRPPTAIAVAKRALVLSGVACRAFLEKIDDDEQRHGLADAIADFFNELDLWPFLEPYEQKVFDCTIGEMPPRMQIRGTWFAEGVSILAWALRRRDFPPHDQEIDPIVITNSLDFLGGGAKDLLISPRLRRSVDLETARLWFYEMHCTLRGFLHYGGSGRLPNWLGEYLHIFNLPPDRVTFAGLLLIDGKPLAELDRARVEACENIIRERHRAAIWLAGEHSVYTDIRVDT